MAGLSSQPPFPRRNGEFLVEHGLAFRSRAELRVYRTLRNHQIDLYARGLEYFTVIPNARAGVLIGTPEPDLIVCSGGRVGIIEVDGPSHEGRRAWDRRRDRDFEQAGFEAVDRIGAEETEEDWRTEAFVGHFLRKLSR